MSDFITQHCLRRLRERDFPEQVGVTFNFKNNRDGTLVLNEFAVTGDVNVAGLRKLAKRLASIRLKEEGHDRSAQGRVRSLIAVNRSTCHLAPQGTQDEQRVFTMQSNDTIWEVSDEARQKSMNFIRNLMNWFDHAEKGMQWEVEAIIENICQKSTAVWCFETARYFLVLQETSCQDILKKLPKGFEFTPEQVEGLAKGTLRVTRLYAAMQEKSGQRRSWDSGMDKPVTVLYEKGDTSFHGVKHRLLKKVISKARAELGTEL